MRCINFAIAGDFGSSGVSTRIHIIRAHESGTRLGVGDAPLMWILRRKTRRVKRLPSRGRFAEGSEVRRAGGGAAKPIWAKLDRIESSASLRGLTRRKLPTTVNTSHPPHQRCNAIPNLGFNYSSPLHASFLTNSLSDTSPTPLLPPAPTPSIDLVLRSRIQLFLRRNPPQKPACWTTL